jgi:hypothetical protein
MAQRKQETMTEQHTLNELYKAQGDLEKAQGLVHAYQDVIRAAWQLMNLPEFTHQTVSWGGPFGAAAANLRAALTQVLKDEMDAI